MRQRRRGLGLFSISPSRPRALGGLAVLGLVLGPNNG
jgi:hypothetical protein